jgi:hypothetical protein
MDWLRFVLFLPVVVAVLLTTLTLVMGPIESRWLDMGRQMFALHDLVLLRLHSWWRFDWWVVAPWMVGPCVVVEVVRFLHGRGRRLPPTAGG